MVNTGHPSRACKLCRTRRIRCDETKPFCLKCQKSKRVCPGYRDPFEINLRDETASTIRKAKAAARKRAVADGDSSPPSEEDDGDGSSSASSPVKRASSLYTNAGIPSSWLLPMAGVTMPYTQDILLLGSDSLQFFGNGATDYSSTSNGAIWDFDGGSSSPASSVSISGLSRSPIMTRSLQTPIDQQATCFFFANYVLMPSTKGLSMGVMMFLLPLLNRPGVEDSPLPLAFSAAAVASLAGHQHSSGMMALADISYSQALEKLNVTLRDEVKAKDDFSLAAVIMLSSYELWQSYTSEETALEGWSKHLNGAKALIKLRGSEVKTASSEAREMFGLVRSAMHRQHMFGLFSVPSEEEIRWWSTFGVDSCDTSIKMHLSTTLVQAEADNILVPGARTSSKIQKVLELLVRAKALLAQFSAYLEGMEPMREKTVVGWAEEQPAEADLSKAPLFPGEVYSFPSIVIASQRITSWMSQAVIAEVVIRCAAWICAPSDHRGTSDVVEAERIGHEAVSRVLSCAPYFASWSGDAVTNPMFICGAPTTPKGFAGMVAMWPLFAIGKSCFCTPRQRKYIQGRLNALSQITGIRIADIFSRTLNDRHELDRLGTMGHAFRDCKTEASNIDVAAGTYTI